MQGNPVLPMMIRKDPNKSGKTACSKDIMESGVSVKPRSLNSEADVKMPLFHVSDFPTAWEIETRTTRL